MVQGEEGLQIYVEQVEQGERGLQIVVEQVEQGQGVCPAETLNLFQSGSTRPCKSCLVPDSQVVSLFDCLSKIKGSEFNSRLVRNGHHTSHIGSFG